MNLRRAMLLVALPGIFASAHAEPTTSTTPLPPMVAPSFFGINGVSYLHYRDSPEATSTAERRMKAVRELGATTDRTDFWWGIIEPRKGVWQWGYTDFLIDFFKKNRIDPLVILAYKAEYSPSEPTTDGQIADYANYVSKVVTRYKDRVHCWEVWNEPNIPTFWKPEPDIVAYTKILKAAYEAAHKADPGCTVIGSATSMTDINWVRGIIKNGGIKYMDALSFHPYSLADGPDEMDMHQQIRNLRETLKQAGRPDLPIWITEMGWKSDVNKPREVHAAAKYVAMSHVIAAAENITRLYWFNLQDWREPNGLEGWGFISPDWRVKNSTDAYKTMSRLLRGGIFKGYVPLKDGIAYVFWKRQGMMAVAWANRGHKSTFDLPRDGARVTSLYGDRTTTGGRSIEVGEDPVYVEYAGPVTFAGMTDKLPVKDNLLVNPSFEETKTWPYAWDRGAFQGGANKGTYEVVRKECADGKIAVALSKTQEAIWQSAPVPALPGETYTLKAKIRTKDATGENLVRIAFLNGAGWGWQGAASSESVTGTTAWKEVTVTGKVPETASVVRVELFSKNNTGKVEFDDLKLTR